MTTETLSTSLPFASTDTVRDPDWLLARIRKILTASQEQAAAQTGEYRTALLEAGYRVRMESLAYELQLYGPAGERVLAALAESTPGLEWHRASGGVYAFVPTDEQAAQIAERLGLTEEEIGSVPNRTWAGELAGFEAELHARIFGPDPTRDSDQ